MKKLIFLLVFLIASITGYSQFIINHTTTPVTVDIPGIVDINDMLLLDPTASSNIDVPYDYVIEEIDGTVYASPYDTSLTAYSDPLLSKVLNSAMGELSSGGKIYIKAGLYDECDSIRFPYGNIEIIGAGKFRTTLKVMDNFDADKSLYGTFGFIAAVNNIDSITIRNIEIDGNGANQTYIDNNISGDGMVGRIIGINIKNNGAKPQYALIENCYVHDATNVGVVLGGDRGTIRNCLIINNFSNQANFGLLSSYNTIEGCTMWGGGDVGMAIYGTYHEIRNNYFGDINGLYGTTGSFDAIALEGGNGDNPPMYNRIINNTIKGTSSADGTLHGIVAYFKSYATTIQGNRISDIDGTGTANGIYLREDSASVITGNVVSNIGDYSMVLSGSEADLVEGNYCSQSTGTAVLALSSYDGSDAIKNFFKDNYFHNVAGYGIQIAADCNDNYFTNNIINGVAWGDLNVSATATGNIWSNNYGIKTGSWLNGRGISTAGTQTKKLTIGTPGDTGQDFTWTGDANSTAQNLDLGSIIPAQSRVTNIEVVCVETVTAVGAVDITMRAGNASAGEQFIVSLSCDDENEVVGIIDAILPAAVIMNYAAATKIWLGGDPDVDWDTLTAGKWIVYVTYIGYN